MARSIAPHLLEPFPTVLQLAPSSEQDALKELLTRAIVQPSFISGVRDNGRGLTTFVFVFDLAFALHRNSSYYSLRQVSACCGDPISLDLCRQCGRPTPLKSHLEFTLERDPEPEVTEDGDLIEQVNVSFAQAEGKLEDHFELLGIDRLSGLLIATEFLGLMHMLLHSSAVR